MTATLYPSSIHQMGDPSVNGLAHRQAVRHRINEVLDYIGFGTYDRRIHFEVQASPPSDGDGLSADSPIYGTPANIISKIGTSASSLRSTYSGERLQYAIKRGSRLEITNASNVTLTAGESISAYGSGNRPIWTSHAEIGDVSGVGSWSNVSGDVWDITFSTDVGITSVLFGDQDTSDDPLDGGDGQARYVTNVLSYEVSLAEVVNEPDPNWYYDSTTRTLRIQTKGLFTPSLTNVTVGFAHSAALLNMTDQTWVEDQRFEAGGISSATNYVVQTTGDDNALACARCLFSEWYDHALGHSGSADNTITVSVDNFFGAGRSDSGGSSPLVCYSDAGGGELYSLRDTFYHGTRGEDWDSCNGVIAHTGTSDIGTVQLVESTFVKPSHRQTNIQQAMAVNDPVSDSSAAYALTDSTIDLTVTLARQVNRPLFRQDQKQARNWYTIRLDTYFANTQQFALGNPGLSTVPNDTIVSNTVFDFAGDDPASAGGRAARWFTATSDSTSQWSLVFVNCEFRNLINDSVGTTLAYVLGATTLAREQAQNMRFYGCIFANEGNGTFAPSLNGGLNATPSSSAPGMRDCAFYNIDSGAYDSAPGSVTLTAADLPDLDLDKPIRRDSPLILTAKSAAWEYEPDDDLYGRPRKGRLTAIGPIRPDDNSPRSRRGARRESRRFGSSRARFR